MKTRVVYKTIGSGSDCNKPEKTSLTLKWDPQLQHIVADESVVHIRGAILSYFSAEGRNFEAESKTG